MLCFGKCQDTLNFKAHVRGPWKPPPRCAEPRPREKTPALLLLGAEESIMARAMLERCCTPEIMQKGSRSKWSCSPGEGPPGNGFPGNRPAPSLPCAPPRSSMPSCGDLGMIQTGFCTTMHHTHPEFKGLQVEEPGIPGFIAITYCVALGKWLNLSEPQFHLLEIRILMILTHR